MKPKQKHQQDDKDGNENKRVMMSNRTKEEHDLWEDSQMERSGYCRAPRQWSCTRKNMKI
jgi:hypothetical protein